MTQARFGQCVPAPALRWMAVAAIGFGSATALENGEAEPAIARLCADENIVVRAAEAADAPLVCDSAQEAITFLAALGLDVDCAITIKLVSELPSTARISPSAVGCYRVATHEVLILSYSRFEERGTWFDVATDPEVYRSVVAHEVAHAIAAVNFKTAKPSIQAQEYLAYVTMFATMTPGLRAQILSSYVIDEPENDAMLSELLLSFDPTQFGARAYLRFLLPENGRAYIHKVLAGEVLLEWW